MKTQMKFGLKEKKKIFSVIMAVILMGLSLSFLIRLNFGTDPCSAMNLGISRQVHLSFGTWQVLFNLVLFLLVIKYDPSQIGWGTLSNMLLVGYSADFFKWLFDLILPADAFTALSIRIIVLIPSLLLFIVSAAVYMAVELGSAPYDAIVFIIASKLKKVPFRLVRILWDMTACLIGFLLGSTIGIVTVMMAFLLGPVITAVKERINRFL